MAGPAKKGIKGISETKQKAGYAWFQGFLKQKPNLSIRKPEGLSILKAAGFNRPAVMKCFSDYEDIIKSLGLENAPGHILNCDETGLQNHFLSSRVVAEFGEPYFE